MKQKRILSQKLLIRALKIGSVGVVLSLVLLLLGAFLISKGSISTAQTNWVVRVSIFLGAFVSNSIIKTKQRGRGQVLTILSSELFYMLLIVLLSAGLPGGKLEWTLLCPLLAISSLGNTTGSLMNFNKMYKRKNAKGKRYTKRNHLKKFT